jgi:hypothetical protein
MEHEFNLAKHVREFHYDYVTLIDHIMSKEQASSLVSRVDALIGSGQIKFVDHGGLGTGDVSDLGGRYLHHIFEGGDVRRHLPELVTLYRAILPLVATITSQDVVLSPYERSDINIKVYPAGGGTLGEHRDTNGITVLLFLTTNAEAPLRIQLPRSHPSKGEWIDRRSIYAQAGTLLLMKGRECTHDCEATERERKVTVVLNYYVRGDTWRHEAFDEFVYDGIDPSGRSTRTTAHA